MQVARNDEVVELVVQGLHLNDLIELQVTQNLGERKADDDSVTKRLDVELVDVLFLGLRERLRRDLVVEVKRREWIVLIAVVLLGF